jgi:membrane-associated phospholipid phosphatase
VTTERYEKIFRFLSSQPLLLSLLKALNRGLPAVVYVAYPLLLAYLAIGRDERVWRFLVVPAVAFVAVTVLRRCLNLPRPYEKLSITPLVRREGRGQSFPSRHACSAAVIAAAFWSILPAAGIVFTVISLLIAAIRILAGLHFPRDIVAGLLLGYALGIAGFLFAA